MNSASLHLLLTLVWTLLLGEFSYRAVVVGYLLGYCILVVFQRVLRSARYVARVQAVVGLLGFFAYELLLANVQVALLALRSRPHLNGMVVAVPLRLRGDRPLTLLSIMTGLMPGTVAMGFSPGRDLLYVHALGMKNAAAARQSVLSVEERLRRIIQLGR